MPVNTNDSRISKYINIKFRSAPAFCILKKYNFELGEMESRIKGYQGL